MLAAFPHLTLQASVTCTPADACGLLEGRTRFARLQLQELNLEGSLVAGSALVAMPPALATALADARLQPGLERLTLSRLNLTAWDAAVCSTLRHLSFSHRLLSPAAALGLSRTLHDGALTSLRFDGGRGIHFDAAGAAEIGAALRANRTLMLLVLDRMILAAPDAAVLVASLVGHRSIRKLFLGGMHLDSAGAALAALVAADAPALTELDVSSCGLGEADLGALCDALPRNRHLRTLNISNRVPAGFIRARLLPGVRDNTGLRNLRFHAVAESDEEAALLEIQDIVRARLR